MNFTDAENLLNQMQNDINSINRNFAAIEKMMINAEFTQESKVCGSYGERWIVNCSERIIGFVNGGYNNFMPRGCKKLVVKTLPESVDIAGVYPERKDTGWIIVNFKDKQESVFVQFSERKDGLFESLIIG